MANVALVVFSDTGRVANALTAAKRVQGRQRRSCDLFAKDGVLLGAAILTAAESLRAARD